MNPSTSFSIGRLGYLLRRDLLQDYRTILIAFVVVIGILKVNAIANTWNGQSLGQFHEFMFPFLLFLGGTIFTTSIFNELNDASRRHTYLSLPASTLEKFISKYLVSSIGFVIFTIVAYWIFALLIGLFAYLAFGSEIAHFKPFSSLNLELMKVYFAVHSVAFLGAIVFDKFAFFKTGISCMALILLTAIITYLFMRIVFWDLFDGWSITNNTANKDLTLDDSVENMMNEWGESVFKFLIFFVFTPLVLATAYFKLKEREV